MNHLFLIRPAQLNQAFESNSSSGRDVEESNLTRRKFLKRTGGATVATLVAWNSLTNPAKATAHPNNVCPAIGGHDGGSCYWVGEINVVFYSHIPYGPNAPGYGDSGRSGGIWMGSLDYSPKMCGGGAPNKVENVPVVIGGYRLAPTDVPPGGDTAIPPGEYYMNAKEIKFGVMPNPPALQEKPNRGFALDPQPTNPIERTGIYVHEKIRPFGSSGCIAFSDRHDGAWEGLYWKNFRNAIVIGNDDKSECPHNDEMASGKLQRIKITVKYTTEVIPINTAVNPNVPNNPDLETPE